MTRQSGGEIGRLSSLLFLMASQEGLEPPTPNLEGSCSILMSYWLLMNGNASRARLDRLKQAIDAVALTGCRLYIHYDNAT